MTTKKKIEEIEEKIQEWVNDPRNKIRTIEPWGNYTKEEFERAIKNLLESQLVKTAGFEGDSGEVESVSYGLVKLKKTHPIGWPLEIGIMVIFEPIEGKAEGEIGVLGFGINPYSKELVGISFYDDSPGFVQQQLESNGGFYFGSSQYTLHMEDMGGNHTFNHFVIPVRNVYRKYFGIAKQIWRQYSEKAYDHD